MAWQLSAEMLRHAILFCVLWGVITLGLSTWRHWKKSDAFCLFEVISLGLVAAAIATAILAAIVYLF